jgi:phospholipid-translocating ATPase
LFLAERRIEEDVYQEWKAKIDAANIVTVNREEEVAAVNELIEVELDLVGSTAIEDRL